MHKNMNSISSPPGGTGVFTWSAAPGPRGISRGNGP